LLRKQPLAEPRSLDGLEILLGDDGVGIDIDRPQGRRDTLHNRELLHRSSPVARSRMANSKRSATAHYQKRCLNDTDGTVMDAECGSVKAAAAGDFKETSQ